MIAPWGWSVLAWILALLAFGTWLMPAGPVQWTAAGASTAILAFCLWFFRNPQRTPPPGDRRLVAPADGVVDGIETIDGPGPIPGPAVKIGIFLSVFDVHVNRAPVAGSVTWAAYRPGAFHDARLRGKADANEANAIAITVDPTVAAGLTVVVRQIAGLIARRIVCAVGVGDRVGRGGLYGMIRFGSRTELLIPANWAHRVLVKPGDRVVGGVTVIAEIAASADGTP